MSWAILSSAVAAPGSGPDRRRLEARTELPSGKFYVGQAIPGVVKTPAGSSPPKLLPAESPDFFITPLGPAESRPLPSSEGQEGADPTIEYRFPLRIVPRRAGRLTVPSLKVELDGRAGATAPLPLAVAAPPGVGRPANFLGGVGRIEPRAASRSTSIRLGDSFDLELTLKGPGSIGSTAPPPLALPQARVRITGQDVRTEPPSRVYRFEIRPLRAGVLTVPPVRVSWLDPSSGRYMTASTRTVPVIVEDVATLRPSDLVRPDLPPARGGSLGRLLAGVGGLLLAAAVLAIARVRARRRRRTVDPRALAEEIARTLASIEDDAEFARHAVGAMADFLHRVGGRRPGVLTPDEARAWVAELTGRADLAGRAFEAVSECDRSLYDEEAAVRVTPETRESMLAMIRDLGGLVGPGKTERGTRDRMG